ALFRAGSVSVVLGSALFSIVLGLPHGPLPALERVRDDEPGVLVHANLKTQFTSVLQLEGESITSSPEPEQKLRRAPDARHWPPESRIVSPDARLAQPRVGYRD